MQETKLGGLVGPKGSVVPKGGLEQVKRSDNVGLDELIWAVDRAIVMAFGGEVQNRVGFGLCDEFMQPIPLGDVKLMKGIDRIGFQIDQ